jgi:hypothetical protein
MCDVAFVAPFLPGKVEDHRRFREELVGKGSVLTPRTVNMNRMVEPTPLSPLRAASRLRRRARPPRLGDVRRVPNNGPQLPRLVTGASRHVSVAPLSGMT